MDVTNHPDAETLDPETLVEEPGESAASLAARTEETERARRLAERYRLDFLDMNEFRITASCPAAAKGRRSSSSCRIRPTCR